MKIYCFNVIVCKNQLILHICKHNNNHDNANDIYQATNIIWWKYSLGYKAQLAKKVAFMSVSRWVLLTMTKYVS